MILHDETIKTYVLLFSNNELERLLKGTQLTIPKDYLNTLKSSERINVRLYKEE